jgi:hypothetical protein
MNWGFSDANTISGFLRLLCLLQLPLHFVETPKVVNCTESGPMIWTEVVLIAHLVLADTSPLPLATSPALCRVSLTYRLLLIPQYIA